MGRILFALMVAQASLPVLAADWSALDRSQQTISRADFERLVTTLYSPSGALTNYLAYDKDSVLIYSSPGKSNAPLYTLRFATGSVNRRPTPVRCIVLDPGHIGGEWARMEERFFVRGADRPVQEAVLNLTVARLLKPQLEAAGLTVLLTKDDFLPVTDKRPEDFRAEAEAFVSKWARLNTFPPLERVAAMADSVRKRQELLFYRNAEIASRARKVNDDLKPDLTVCLHFNAVEWNEHFELVDDNRLLLYVHGHYLDNEITGDDDRLRLFTKLLERSHETELAVADSIADALSRATGLPPVRASGAFGLALGKNPAVYARNLAANRLINGPVVYLEPYYMNNRTVYQRIQLGDYDGVKEIDNVKYRSLYREYADAVAEGLLRFVKATAPVKTAAQ